MGATQIRGDAEPGTLSLGRCIAAHRSAADVVLRTPAIPSAALSERCGGTIVLKAECLQRTGAFKLRGALSKLRALGGAERGVVAGSAGNHAQGVAFAARHRGIPCEIFMPVEASRAKLTAVKALGATVRLEGETVEETLAAARERAADAGMAFVHPYDDLDVIAGQAGVGIELAEDVDALAKVVVPLGGGGLASGAAFALKQLRPEVEVVAVELGAVRRGPVDTIADGIAVRRVGERNAPLLERWVDDIVRVEDDAIGEAMVQLLAGAKLVVEGAGATPLAALLSGLVAPAQHGATALVVSGGNVDTALLASIVSRVDAREGRRARIVTRVSDRPGALAALLAVLARCQANVVQLEHLRDEAELPLRAAAVALTVDVDDDAHQRRVLAELAAGGYELRTGR